MSADKRLLEYIRLNRLAKSGKDLKMGHTYLIPFMHNDKVTEFMFDLYKNKFQYIVCYTMIENENLTRQISQYLRPLQFSKETESMQVQVRKDAYL